MDIIPICIKNLLTVYIIGNKQVNIKNRCDIENMFLNKKHYTINYW